MSFNTGNSNSRRGCDGSADRRNNGGADRRNGGARRHFDREEHRYYQLLYPVENSRQCLNCLKEDHRVGRCRSKCGWCGEEGHNKDYCRSMKRGEPPCEGSSWTEIFMEKNPQTCVPVVEVQKEKKTYNATFSCAEPIGSPTLKGWSTVTAKVVTKEALAAQERKMKETHIRLLNERVGKTESPISERTALKMIVEGCPCKTCRVPCGVLNEEVLEITAKVGNNRGNKYQKVEFTDGTFIKDWEEVKEGIPDANPNHRIKYLNKFCFRNDDKVVMIYLYKDDCSVKSKQISTIRRDLTYGMPKDIQLHFQVHTNTDYNGTPKSPPEAIVDLMWHRLPAELEISDTIYATGVFTYDEWDTFVDYCVERDSTKADQKLKHTAEVERFMKYGAIQSGYPSYELYTIDTKKLSKDIELYQLKYQIERTNLRLENTRSKEFDRISCEDGRIYLTRLANMNGSIPSVDTAQLEIWKSSVEEWFASNQVTWIRQIRQVLKEKKEAARKRAATAKALPTAQMTRSKGAHRSGAAKAKEVKGFGPTSKSSVGKCLPKPVEPVHKNETEKPVVSNDEVAEVARIIKAEARTDEEEKFRAKIVRLLGKLNQSHRLQKILKTM